MVYEVLHLKIRFLNFTSRNFNEIKIHAQTEQLKDYSSLFLKKLFIYLTVLSLKTSLRELEKKECNNSNSQIFVFTCCFTYLKVKKNFLKFFTQNLTFDLYFYCTFTVIGKKLSFVNCLHKLNQIANIWYLYSINYINVSSKSWKVFHLLHSSIE